MKRLSFSYYMRLDFEGVVKDHFFELRILPVEDARQQIYGLVTKCRPSICREGVKDGFGNRVASGIIHEEHSCFEVKMEGIAFVSSEKIKAEDLFLYSACTPLLKENEDILSFYHANRCEGSAEEKAMHWMHRVHQIMTYIPRITDVNTTSAQVFALKQGVCQDYAHLFLTFMHLEGIPCRYIAGMVSGIGESHAWVEVEQDGYWVGYDPTNDCLVNENYIKLACGRDSLDCVLNKGVFKGFVQQKQTVVVKVEEQ